MINLRFLLISVFALSLSAKGNIEKLSLSPLEITTRTEVPLELQQIINEVSIITTEQKQRKSILNTLTKLDSILINIDPKTMKSIIHSEVLKTFLNKKLSDTEYSVRLLNKETLTKLKLIQEDKETSTFTKWLLSSIYQDLEFIFTSAEFTTFLYLKKQNRSPKTMNRKMRKYDQKLSYLIPLASNAIELGPKKFSEEVQLKLGKTLKNITQLGTSHLSNSSFEFDSNKIPSLDKLKNFKFSNLTSPKSTKPSKSFKLFPLPDKNYVAPEKLPKPVSSWNPKDDMDELKDLEIKALKDENSKGLPAPVNEWLDLQ